jgi:hypothetical protein
MTKQKNIVRLAVGIAALMFSADAMAATQSVTSNISFDTPLTITPNQQINFGTVAAGTAGTYTISTAGSVTTANGNWLYGTKAAGNLTIAGSTTDTISISVVSYTASNGVTPSNATCAYAGGAAGSCTLSGIAAPGTGKTLLLGVDATVDGTQAAGTSATPSFVVTVTYM